MAIDFETADDAPDSACAVALVRVEMGRLWPARPASSVRHAAPSTSPTSTVSRGTTLPRSAALPKSGTALPLLEGTKFVAAHNVAFDRSVLMARLRNAGLPLLHMPFLCTVALARQTWNLRPTRLPDVCRHLGLSLTHHNALSDAEACARHRAGLPRGGHRGELQRQCVMG